jgi:hypothetical protein
MGQLASLNKFSNIFISIILQTLFAAVWMIYAIPQNVEMKIYGLY